MPAVNVTISGIENCKVIIDGFEFNESGQYFQGATVENPIIIEVIANEGFVFDNTTEGNFVFRGALNNVVLVLEEITTYNPIYESNWQDGFTRFYYEANPSDYGGIRAGLFKAVEGSSSGGTDIPDYGSSIVNRFANIYNVEPDELKTLSKEIFLDTDANRADLESFITGLYILPFNIDDIRKDTKSSIILANFLADTNSYTLEDSILTVEVAEIEVPETYGNSYDYINTECFLFLPYLEKQELEITRIINKTVKVLFIIDLFDGIANCNIFADEDLIMTIEQEIGRNIPYYSKISRNFAESRIGKVKFNTITLPYIEVVRNVPYNEVEGVGNQISQVDMIGNLAGYVEVETIHLETSATKREQEMITSQLRNGVIIQ